MLDSGLDIEVGTLTDEHWSTETISKLVWIRATDIKPRDTSPNSNVANLFLGLPGIAVQLHVGLCHVALVF